MNEFYYHLNIRAYIYENTIAQCIYWTTKSRAAALNKHEINEIESQFSLFSMYLLVSFHIGYGSIIYPYCTKKK